MNDIISSILPVSVSAQQKIEAICSLQDFEKGSLLMESNRIEKQIYFLKEGIVRAYALLDEEERTFWFGEEGSVILSMRSYVESKASYESLEALENCRVYRMSIEDLQQLFENDIEIANWGRKLAEYELLKLETRLITRDFLSASARYQDLMNRHPSLLRRVSLKHIASYLGITQVSLSRIRKEMSQGFLK